MRLLINPVIFVLLVAGISSCRKPYNPPVTTTDYAYLVVEGVINSGVADSTVITLSRTVPLNADTTLRPETGAKVIVESNQNTQYQLIEKRPGAYVAQNLNLPTAYKYRLHIYTASGREYTSDYAENKITPPIDTITHTFLPNGVQFYLNAHDPSNNTRYYRWEYHEYWSYYTAYATVLQYQKGAVIGLPVDSDFYYCYRNATPANGIFIGTSDKLSQDVIYQQPLNYVAGQSGKLVSEYVLEVRQFAITPEAYTYWQQLKTNTEDLGSIFDAQPSSPVSNVHSISNPNESVIGYVSVSTSTLKRATLTQAEVPFAVVPVIGPLRDTLTCTTDTLFFDPQYSLTYRLSQTFSAGNYLPYDFAYNSLNVAYGYKYAEAGCVDCRKLGGTNIKPVWWPWPY
jgi:hypothetical protein